MDVPETLLEFPIARGIIEPHGETSWVGSDGTDGKNCPGHTFHVLLTIRIEPLDLKYANLFSVETKFN